MIGYIITTHGDNYDLVSKALKSILEYSCNDKYIVLFDNEGIKEKHEELKKNIEANEFIFIENQKDKGGLTYTWNEGIRICLNNKCDAVILLNNDIVANETLSHLEQAVMNRNEPGIYSCTSNKAPWGNHLKQQEYIKSDVLIVDKHKNRKGPGGFCLAIPKEVLIKNKFDNYDFFDPKYFFGGNERYYNNRWHDEHNGSVYIVRSCIIYHERLNSWTKIKL